MGCGQGYTENQLHPGRNLILVWILPGISEQGPNKNTIPHPSLHAEDIFEDLYVYLLGDGYHLGLIQKDIQGDFY